MRPRTPCATNVQRVTLCFRERVYSDRSECKCCQRCARKRTCSFCEYAKVHNVNICVVQVHMYIPRIFVHPTQENQISAKEIPSHGWLRSMSCHALLMRFNEKPCVNTGELFDGTGDLHRCSKSEKMLCALSQTDNIHALA